jgi:hypothetical protein
MREGKGFPSFIPKEKIESGGNVSNMTAGKNLLIADQE